MGEHTREVLVEWLELSNDASGALRRRARSGNRRRSDRRPPVGGDLSTASVPSPSIDQIQEGTTSGRHQ